MSFAKMTLISKTILVFIYLKLKQTFKERMHKQHRIGCDNLSFKKVEIIFSWRCRCSRWCRSRSLICNCQTCLNIWPASGLWKGSVEGQDRPRFPRLLASRCQGCLQHPRWKMFHILYSLYFDKWMHADKGWQHFICHILITER